MEKVKGTLFVLWFIISVFIFVYFAKSDASISLASFGQVWFIGGLLGFIEDRKGKGKGDKLASVLIFPIFVVGGFIIFTSSLAWHFGNEYIRNIIGILGPVEMLVGMAIGIDIMTISKLINIFKKLGKRQKITEAECIGNVKDPFRPIKRRPVYHFTQDEKDYAVKGQIHIHGGLKEGGKHIILTNADNPTEFIDGAEVVLTIMFFMASIIITGVAIQFAVFVINNFLIAK